MTTTTTGTVAIIGGGISGLTAAASLRRAGWSVSVYERSCFKNEIGAGITVPPNAALVLHHLGFDFERARPVPNQTMRLSVCAAPAGEDFVEEVYLDLGRECFGGKNEGVGSWTFHRVDLHRGLRELAEEEDESGGKGKKVEMNLGCEVIGLDCEAGILTLADGRMVQKDLVVVADGAHSTLLQSFTGGGPSQVYPTGRSIYRWLVSMDEVFSDPLVAPHYDPTKPTGFIGFTDTDKDILWATYLCRGGTVLNNAVVHDTQAGEGDEDLWHSSVTKEQVLKHLSNFDESRNRIVNMASEDGIKVHHLFKRPPLASFVKGRAVVVGDAAHVMMPTHAAGGAVAIESAATLEVLFRDVDGADEKTVKDRLKLFDLLRVPRCNLTMLASNAGPAWLSVPGVEEEIRRFYQGPLPPVGTFPWTRPFRELLFHHDAYQVAEEALLRDGESSGLGLRLGLGAERETETGTETELKN